VTGSQHTNQLLDRLRDYPDFLRDLIAHASDEELTRAAPGGGWGVVEVICHLRDLDELFIERVSRMIHEDDPYMPAVDETLWPIERDYASQDPWEVLEEFAERREQFVQLLEGLRPEQWERRGYHEQLGEQTVRWYAEHAAEHDAEHAEHLRELLA
jgi:hypothetical protein